MKVSFTDVYHSSQSLIILVHNIAAKLNEMATLETRHFHMDPRQLSGPVYCIVYSNPIILNQNDHFSPAKAYLDRSRTITSYVIYL